MEGVGPLTLLQENMEIAQFSAWMDSSDRVSIKEVTAGVWSELLKEGMGHEREAANKKRKGRESATKRIQELMFCMARSGIVPSIMDL